MRDEEVPGDPLRAAAYMVAASCSFAVMAAMVKIAALGASVWATVFIRSAVVAAVAWALIRGRGAKVGFNNHGLLLLRSGSGLLAMLCYFWALGHAPMADAVTLQYTSPLFVAALAPVAVRERVRPATVAWLVFGFVGVLMVVRPEGEVSLGALAALASAVFAAVAYLSVRRLRTTDLPDAIVLHFALVALLVSLPGAVELALGSFGVGQWLALLGVGVFASGGQLGMTRAYRLGEAAVVSGLGYVTVAVGIGVGLLAFGEVPTLSSVVGAVVVSVAGIALARS